MNINKMENLEYYFDDIDVCECIGMFEDEYVYDVEVDDETHTFIANDMLVHNSLYISFTNLGKSVGYDFSDMKNALKFILHMNGNFIKHLFNSFLDEYAKPYGVKNIHDFELETINKSGLHIEKKMYINNCVWEDGVFHEDLSTYLPKGIDIVRSSTPLFVRERIWEVINYLFKDPDNVNIKDILKIIKDIKKEYLLAPLEDISMTTSLSNYNDKVIDDQGEIKCVKGAHFSIKAAALHNYILNKNSTYKQKYDLLKGGKVKYYFCKSDYDNNRFAYMRNFHPTELCEMEGIVVDYDEQFTKTFISIVNRFLLHIGLPPINKRLSVLNSLFSKKKVDVDDVDIDDGKPDEDDEFRIKHTNEFETK